MPKRIRKAPDFFVAEPSKMPKKEEVVAASDAAAAADAVVAAADAVVDALVDAADAAVDATAFTPEAGASASNAMVADADDLLSGYPADLLPYLKAGGPADLWQCQDCLSYTQQLVCYCKTASFAEAFGSVEEYRRKFNINAHTRHNN